ncbi:FAD-dependent monooxygenase [Nocardia sp. Marseille-Q1738]
MSVSRIPVLIVGAGSVGLFAAVFLAHHGVAVHVVERAPGPSIHPRATGLGPRTMEFLREVALADEVNAAAVDMSAGSRGRVSGATLASIDFSSIAAAPTRPWSVSDLISPAAIRGICAQDRLDAVLAPAAAKRGAVIRYSTALVALEEDADGVTARLDDGTAVRADYVIAADGVRSGVRAALGIGTSGPGALGNPKMSILFRADLLPYTHGRHFATAEITGSDAPGLLVTVDGAREWIFHTDYHPEAGQSADDFTDERCRALIRTAVGDPALEPAILSRMSWRARGLLADKFRDGRVFLVGDAAHAVPPQGAFGLNTGAADAHNLAWKLAAVLRGQAGSALLDTYESERRAVASFTLDQALLRVAHPRLHWDISQGAGAARAEVGMVNGPVVAMGYRYDSAAVIDARTDLPDTEELDSVLDATPGSRLPHLWIGEGESTLDLVRSQFCVLAGPGGARWVGAARAAGDRLGVAVGAQVIDVPEWPRRAAIASDGALLVRPDHIVAWRADAQGGDPADALSSVLRRLLHRD